MRYDPRRALLEESELQRLRQEVARLRNENERLAAMPSRTTGPLPPPHSMVSRAPAASREQPWKGRLLTALLVGLAFTLGLVYADHLSQGEARRGFLIVWTAFRS